MIIEISKDEINALKWLFLKGMESTHSDSKFNIFEKFSDKLHSNKEDNSFKVNIHHNKDSITGTIYLNGKFYTEIGCADLPEFFKILSEHEIIEDL